MLHSRLRRKLETVANDVENLSAGKSSCHDAQRLVPLQRLLNFARVLPDTALEPIPGTMAYPINGKTIPIPVS